MTTDLLQPARFWLCTAVFAQCVTSHFFPAPTEQSTPPSVPLKKTNEKRGSKKRMNSLTKQYMDSSDSQDSIDSVT